MRIVFMGTPMFAVPSLETLCRRKGTEVIGVFTQPDRPSGRGNKVKLSSVKEAAVRLGIPVFQPEKIRRDGIEQLRELGPDLCVTAAFGQILTKEILDIPPLGNINVHASLLPRHRGSSPIAHAILSGDTRTGITTMMMDEGIDTGDILMQEETEIGSTETCEELTQRLSLIGAVLLERTLDCLEKGELVRTQQNESEMTYDPMLKKEMGFLDLTQSAEEVKGRINGLNPWPCATLPYGEGRIKLLRAEVTPETGEAGTILVADTRRGMILACGERSVRVLEVQAPGGKRMHAADFLRGHPLPEGEKWEG